jgi:hypothetical protein
MEPLKMAQQMIDFQKTTFLPAEGKKILSEWVQTFKKGREEFRKAVDEGFGKVEAYFAKAGEKS